MTANGKGEGVADSSAGAGGGGGSAGAGGGGGSAGAGGVGGSAGAGGGGGSASSHPSGLRGDLARLFSATGTHEGRPTLGRALQRALTRPGPLALVIFRISHRIWRRGWHTSAELLWRLNVFLTGADIHPGAEIGGGLRLTHTAGLVVGRGARIGSNVTLLHGVTLGGSGKAWFDPSFDDGYPEIGDDTIIFAGAKVLGPIKVGRGCFIGANAVLARDLPDGAAYTAGREVKQLRREVEDLRRRLDQHPGEGAGSRPEAQEAGAAGSRPEAQESGDAGGPEAG